MPSPGALALEIFIAILVCVALGLAWTSRPAYRLRRRRTVAAFVSGGWVSVFVGITLGPSGFGFISREAVLESVPLIAAALGAVGFMIGFQMRGSVLRTIPASFYRAAAADILLTAALVGGIGLLGLRIWVPGASAAELWLPMAFLIAASFGWSMETRSLGSTASPHLGLWVRVTGALLGIAALVCFGMASKAVERDAFGILHFSTDRALLKVLHTVVLALAIGFLGRFMIGLASDRAGHQFAVFLGLIAFTAGSAKQLDTSPLFSSLLAGAVMANLKAPGLRTFESFIARGEHVMGVFFGVLVGILLRVDLGLAPVMLGVAIFAVRTIVKPGVVRAESPDLHELSVPEQAACRMRLAGAVIRQSPIMLALGVSLILIEPSAFHKQLVSVVVLTGILCETQVALMLHQRRSRAAGSEAAAAAGTVSP
ncbi:MAG: hypothetical protein KDA21_07375 [Phycisphaerales bacterium]|nr:hypothetical protein [Phycisphaerales bacterium]